MNKNKPFKMTAELTNGDKIAFGIFNGRVWVMVEPRYVTHAISSLDNPKRAVRLARQMLEPELWPQFAIPLLRVLDDDNKNQDVLI